MKDPTLSPQTVSEALSRLLQLGLVFIRSRPQDGQLCARVADYLHNLPDIALNPTDELLDFHWNVERRAYLREATPEERNFFLPFWEQLRPFVPHPKLEDESFSAVILPVAA